MIKTRFSVPEDQAALVRRIANSRKVSEASIWREVVALGCGVYLENAPSLREGGAESSEAIDVLLRICVESLAVNRRLARHFDEKIVITAKEDALAILEKVGA